MVYVIVQFILLGVLGAIDLSSLFLQQFVGYLYKAELV